MPFAVATPGVYLDHVIVPFEQVALTLLDDPEMSSYTHLVWPCTIDPVMAMHAMEKLSVCQMIWRDEHPTGAGGGGAGRLQAA